MIPVSGGDINQNYRIEGYNQSYFLKIHPNIRKAYFEAEVDGLKVLSPYVRVPETYMLGELQGGAYLLMEWIKPRRGNQKDLAVSLVNIHKITAPQFGY